jgi:salicylate hydroxylase
MGRKVMKRLHAIVIGAGIGGLAAAIAMRRAGLDVSVYEQAAAIGEVGAGIQISPNASRLLQRYGLGDAMARVAVRPAAIVHRRWQDGRELSRQPLGDSIESRYGAPYYHFHRADLIGLLAQAFGSETLALGHRLTRVGEDGHGIAAHFDNGVVVHGDLLIGADGIHSKVREHLFGRERPRFSGNVAYRGLAPVERVAHLGLAHEATNWVGPGGHFVHYFVGGGRFLNFVAVTEQGDWTREGWSDRGSVADAVRSYAGWHPQIAAILQAVDETFKWALFDRDPLARWSRGRVVLLGDACHPMLPYMAQGAAQAIEDGAMLAACLRDVAPSDIEAALDAYAAKRQPRTAWVQQAARANSVTFHLRDGPEQIARDQLYRERGGRGGPQVVDRLFGYDAEDLAAATA